jgi:uncharacterized phage infection (PIP) family protein YhgE
METQQQLGLMDKIVRELDDLKNSQTSVLKKIAQVEADNINLGSSLLEEGLPSIHEEVDDAIQKISTLLEQFRESRDNFQNEHPVQEISS